MTTAKPKAAIPAVKAQAKPAAQSTSAEASTGDEQKKEAKTKKVENGYTYIGMGEDSPRVINLMGKQKFVRGELTEVTDADILAKIDGMQTFVKGEADQETMHRIDEEAKAQADLQRAEDLLINNRFKKKHHGEK